MIVHAVSDGLFVAEYHPADAEFDRVVHALNLSDERLTRLFVTISRGPLDEEFLHAKITEGQRELRDAGSQEQLPF